MAVEDKLPAFAQECVRLAELTDNADLKSYLLGLALESMADAAAERHDHSNVISFPWLASS
jgi:hypothetical protein